MTPHSFAWLALLLGALCAGAPSLALAEQSPTPLGPVADLTEDPVLGIEGSGALRRVDAVAVTPRPCTPRYMAGPAVGVAVAPAAAVGGFFLALKGGFRSWRYFDPDMRRARYAGGMTIMAVSAVAFLYSAGKLAVNHRERKKVCGDEEVRQLAHVKR